MDQLSVVVVQTNDYLGRGAEYVKKLRRQVRKHLTLPHEFFVVTDDPASFYPRMKVKPAALPGWWEKLRLFKPGMFPDGRVLFLDLDTFIVGNIDDIASYDGPFATLRDFWRKDGLGPAVMIWRTDAEMGIWEEFVAEGMKMTHPQGDQGFREPRPGALQAPHRPPAGQVPGAVRVLQDALRHLHPGRCERRLFPWQAAPA